MIPQRLITPMLTAAFVAVLCLGYLLDGPSELEAMQATADSVDDAIKSAASQASNTPARGQKDLKTVVAGVKP